jgi:hypothetical protein
MSAESHEEREDPEMQGENATCAWCHGSLAYSPDPEKVLCTNCTYYIKKQHPDLYHPCLRANLMRLRGLAHRRFCWLLLVYADLQARNHLRPKDYAAFRLRHDERIA